MSASTITGECEYNAPAEVVFGVLTDPDRAKRWLPHHDYDVEVANERLRVEWHSRDIPGLRGSAWVEDAPAGGSVTHAEVAVPDEVAGPERAHGVLMEALQDLQRDVSDNFNAG